MDDIDADVPSPDRDAVARYPMKKPPTPVSPPGVLENRPIRQRSQCRLRSCRSSLLEKRLSRLILLAITANGWFIRQKFGNISVSVMHVRMVDQLLPPLTCNVIYVWGHLTDDGTLRVSEAALVGGVYRQFLW